MVNKIHIIGLLMASLIVTGVYAGEVTVSSGTSVDLTTHRRPYATVLKMGQKDFNVVGAAIVNVVPYKGQDHLKQNAFALVFYSDGTWSMGATNIVDSVGGGKYLLPKGKYPKDIVGVGIAGSLVFVWFGDGTVCRGRFPTTSFDKDELGTVHEEGIYRRLKRNGTIYCGVSGVGKHYGYSVTHGNQPKDVVAVGIDGSNNMVFAYYCDGTVSAGTSNDLDNKRPATKYRLPGDKSPQDIIDIGIDGFNHHVYAFYRDKPAPKRYQKFKMKTQK